MTRQLLAMVALTMKANWSATAVPHVVGGAFVLDVSVIEVWIPAKLSWYAPGGTVVCRAISSPRIVVLPEEVVDRAGMAMLMVYGFGTAALPLEPQIVLVVPW